MQSSRSCLLARVSRHLHGFHMHASEWQALISEYRLQLCGTCRARPASAAVIAATPASSSGRRPALSTVATVTPACRRRRIDLWSTQNCGEVWCYAIM